MLDEPQVTVTASAGADTARSESGPQLRGAVWQDFFRSKLLLERTQQLAKELNALYRDDSR